MLYFAYGSNLLKRRLQERTPAAKMVGAATLAGHSLRFHKIGDDGSGKCDAFHTGDEDHKVHGVLYELGAGERQILDRIEGVGCGYEIRQIDVKAPEPVAAFTYVVQQNYIDPNIQPFCWYRNFVLAGAMAHQFPQPYVQKIGQVAFRNDPDLLRRSQNDAILERAGLNPDALRNGTTS